MHTHALMHTPHTHTSPTHTHLCMQSHALVTYVHELHIVQPIKRIGGELLQFVLGQYSAHKTMMQHTYGGIITTQNSTYNISHTHAHTHAHTCTRTRTHTHTHTHAHTHTHTCTHTHTHTHAYTRTHTHTRTHARTHTH